LRYCANQISARNNAATNILSYVVAVLVQIKTVPRNSTLYEKQCGVVSALAVTSALPTASVAAGRFIVFVAALYINMLMTSFVARHAAATSWVLVVLAS
jgi:hypothetical protein